MKKIRYTFLVALTSALFLGGITGCDITELDINTDPNNPSTASLDLLLAETMYAGMNTFSGTLNYRTNYFMYVLTSQSDFNLTNNSFNGTWNSLYHGPLKDLEEIVVAARAQGNNPHYLGVAQVMKAYYFSLMVDLWGDVPYSEAFKGNADDIIKYPVYDDDAAIYANLLELVDSAMLNFEKPSPVGVEGDLFFNGDIDDWMVAAQSLKFRLLMNTRLVNPNAAADIQAIIDEGGYIDAPSENWVMEFSTTNNPDNRHPWYRDAYGGSTNDFAYFGHQFMFEMLRDEDPRLPFYLKRQTEDILDQDDPTDKQTTPCSQVANCTYGYFVLSPTVTNALYGKNPEDLSDSEAAYLAGFFGRDRSDISGIPADGPLRTSVGVYPVGGLYDVEEASATGGNQGPGNGIFPIITDWMTLLYEIEANLALGVTIDMAPRDAFEEVMRSQMAQVFDLSASWDPNAVEPEEDDVDDYVDLWLSRYDAAGTDNAKLNVVLKQAWFTNFGNGYEVYNAFRRTGYPNDLQDPLNPIRNFALRLPYATDELNLNTSNVPEIVFDSPTDKLFWDEIGYQFD